MDIERRKFLGAAALVGTVAATHAIAAMPGVSDQPLPRLLNNRRLIIDTDPGNDDAVALLMALGTPEVRVEAITIAPGNIDYQQEVRNALYIVELAGKGGKVSVHRGIERPLLNFPYPKATFIHGKYGLGAVEVPEVNRKAASEHAVDAIRRVVKAYPGEVVIVALGALTNIAMALLMEPSIAKLIKGIVFVARVQQPIAGFNSMADPEAAHIVLTSGVPVTIAGPDDASILTPGDFDYIGQFNTARSRFFIQSNELRLKFGMSARGQKGAGIGDALAVAMLIDPSIALDYRAVAAKVELEGHFTRGSIIYGDNKYTLEPTPAANVNICVAASNDGFKKLVFRTLSQA